MSLTDASWAILGGLIGGYIGLALSSIVLICLENEWHIEFIDWLKHLLKRSGPKSGITNNIFCINYADTFYFISAKSMDAASTMAIRDYIETTEMAIRDYIGPPGRPKYVPPLLARFGLATTASYQEDLYIDAHRFFSSLHMHPKFIDPDSGVENLILFKGTRA